MKLFNSWTRMLRRMNYLQNMDGMYNRYMRERTGWDNHLHASINYIKEFVNRQQNREEAVVLGSGWMLDVPLEYLSEKYKSVLLADVHHPSQVRHKYRMLKNVQWIETDLTGGYMQAVYAWVRKNGSVPLRAPLNTLTPSPDEAFLSLQPDSAGNRHYFSINLMSQLDGMLADYLRDHCPGHTDGLTELRKKIQQVHLDLLLHASSSCLITDFVEVRKSTTRAAAEEIPLILANWPDSSHNKQWTWSFDRSGSYIPGTEVRMLVKAVSLQGC